MQPLDANQSWFTFSAASANYAVYAFRGTERVNEPFEFTIHFISENSNLPTASLLGMEGTLTVADRSGKSRFVHGIISQIRQLHTGIRFTHYQCLLVPRLRFLQECVGHRIYQRMDVKQIIDDILTRQKFAPELYELRLSGTYKLREYCTQYGESDYHFLCRLCEEEGIAFFFEHTENRHCLVFTDSAGGPPIAGEADIRFYSGSGTVADAPVISRVTHQQRINGDRAAYRDWNAMAPTDNLDVSRSETDRNKAPTPTAMTLETYRYPHIYQERKDGEHYAEIQLARQLVFREWLEGTTDASRMTPGQVFGMHEHPRADLNRQWWLYEVVHQGDQPGVLEEEAPEERGHRYTASFAAIPAQTRFVPEIRHEKPRVAGVQSALVTGPEGEDIYTDKYGRVKVRFFWDRRDKSDDTASCWLRVAQGWSGSGFGMLAVPRVDSEVLVSFEEGDPDRPIVTGRAYHAGMPLPCELPAGKTRTVLRSQNSPGGIGSNELSIEDKFGEEEIYVQALRDLSFFVLHDWSDLVAHDRLNLTKNDVSIGIMGETHAVHRKSRKTEITDDDHITIHGDRQERIDRRWLVDTKKQVHIKAGTKLVLDAGTELTLRVGSNFIKIDPSGVRIKGKMLRLNSGGSAGKGTPAKPEQPELLKSLLEKVIDSLNKLPSSPQRPILFAKQGGAGGNVGSASGKSSSGKSGTDSPGPQNASGADKRNDNGNGSSDADTRDAAAQSGTNTQQSLQNAQAAAQPLASNCSAQPKEKKGGK